MATVHGAAVRSTSRNFQLYLGLVIHDPVVGLDGASHRTVLVAGRLPLRFSPHRPSVVDTPLGRRRPIDAAAAAVSQLAAEGRLLTARQLRATTEYVDEDAAELLSEDAVENEVDRAVGDHHQTADARQLDERERVENLGLQRRHEDVVDDRRHLKKNENVRKVSSDPIFILK